MDGILKLMFINVIIQDPLKPGKWFSLELPDYLHNGVSRNFQSPFIKFTILGRVKVITEWGRVPSGGKIIAIAHTERQTLFLELSQCGSIVFEGVESFY